MMHPSGDNNGLKKLITMNELEKLQEQLAFQERTIEQLNDALTSQQRQISQLNEKLDVTVKLIKTLQSDNRNGAGEGDTIEYEIPPHY